MRVRADWVILESPASIVRVAGVMICKWDGGSGEVLRGSDCNLGFDRVVVGADTTGRGFEKASAG